MNINDEGSSNAAHWHERAMKAEARLAEADDKLLSVAIELGTTKARLAEASLSAPVSRSALASPHRVHP